MRNAPRRDLFLASLLVIVLELACIRWFPAHVLFLTFFTNVMLLAAFVGMSAGCLAARSRRDHVRWTPLALVAALACGLGVEAARNLAERHVAVGDGRSPQVVYFGTEYHAGDVSRFAVPVEVLAGLFFVLVALAHVGPGQELGRAFARMPDRLAAYTVNVSGSLTGVALFGLMAWMEWPPPVWFAAVTVGIGYFTFPARSASAGHGPPAVVLRASLIVVALLPMLTTGAFKFRGHPGEHHWSPYYRVDRQADTRLVIVNQLGHQQMQPCSRPVPAYSLPHLLRRDAGGEPFVNVLVIGAGTGNDVSRALAWPGVRRVDAVEIDPAIARLGRDHPNQPYDDPRVTLHLDDGRNFLRRTDRHYDLIVYALVDSLVLHSGYSSLRLESYLFTAEAFRDVRARLKPDGLFVMSNYFRQGWLVARLNDQLRTAFGSPPLVLTMPYRDRVQPDEAFDGFTMVLAGDTASLARSFSGHAGYRLALDCSLGPDSPNGFTATTGERFGPAVVESPSDLRAATDDWPFPYLRSPTVPVLTWRGMAVMGGLAIVLLAMFSVRGPCVTENLAYARAADTRTNAVRMFFLGAAFMLIETKAVVHMALLFGSTWIVNSIVIAAILLMILAANAYVRLARPTTLGPYFLALGVALAVNFAVPLEAFLGWPRLVQVGGACVLAVAPVGLAGVIFAASFARADNPDRAFGWNVAGAVLGGLAENVSLMVGFRGLTLVAAGLYLLAAWGRDRSVADEFVEHRKVEVTGDSEWLRAGGKVSAG